MLEVSLLLAFGSLTQRDWTCRSLKEVHSGIDSVRKAFGYGDLRPYLSPFGVQRNNVLGEQLRLL